ncbi:MAG: hypothetical protein H0T47_24270 [Planctomycetaceae bacterium]|nr:hypothetical protein [Planctomycetaceae bacterium]
MTAAYTPGLKVSKRMRYRIRRTLPVPGDVLVKVGDRVQATDVVAQATMPGDITPVDIANVLAVPPGEAPGAMLISVGDTIALGDVVARSKGIFGMFRAEYHAKTAGVIESISGVTGQVIVRGEPKPVEVLAYLAGEVVDVVPRDGVVIEAEVAFIQGIFGVGGEAFGKIALACKAPTAELTEDLITEAMAGKIVIGGARMTGTAIRKAVAVGAAAVVSGGMDDADLRAILGYDLGVAVTGSENIGTTLVITEGFGEIAMAERTYRLFAEHADEFAAVNGTTQIRAGVMRPEIVIPLGAAARDEPVQAKAVAGLLEPGTAVRIIRDPYFGLIGDVASLPSEPAILPSGSKARVLDVRLDSGQTVTVPRANVELIER